MQSLKMQILEILSEDCRTPLERIAVMTGAELVQVAEAVEELERDRVILSSTGTAPTASVWKR